MAELLKPTADGLTPISDSTPAWCDLCGWVGTTSQIAFKDVLIGKDDVSKEPCCPRCKSICFEIGE